MDLINYFWRHFARYINVPLIPQLKLNNAHFSDANKVNEILKKFIADGPDKLQIVTDFDQTLTMHTYEGKRCDSCHGVLDNSSFLPDDFRKKAAKLRETYAPIEFDPKIETQLKIPKMEEWWGQVHSLLGSLNITRGLISEMVSQSSVRLRSGCNEFFKSLDQLNIPVLIISAGLGDILKEIINQQSNIYNNMKIVSNFMKFNEDKMIGFENEIIHTFNKSKCEIHKSDYFRNQRSNVILMGDTLGDLDLAEGVPKHFTVIKVGYLNDRVEDSLELYKKEFDIVLVKTESVDLMNSIIKTMVEKKGETKNKD